MYQNEHGQLMCYYFLIATFILAGTARHLIQHFRQSPKAQTALKKKYAMVSSSEDPQTINLIMDSKTQWNSAYEMLQKLCNHQFVVRLILNDANVTPRQTAMHLELRDNHWVIIQKLVELLEPMKVSRKAVRQQYK